MRLSKKVPDGWAEMLSCGQVVPGTQIIPFKVPRASWLVKDFLIDQLMSDRVVGMIIDLTNTQYYDPNSVPSKVQYIKFNVPGHDKAPSHRVASDFVRIVSKFHETNDDTHVAVHCTHGINRTGYLVCCYLVEQKGLSVKQALELFATARGIPMYNILFIISLFKKYNQLNSDEFTSFEFSNYPPWAHLKKQLQIAQSALTVVQQEKADATNLLKHMEQLRKESSQHNETDLQKSRHYVDRYQSRHETPLALHPAQCKEVVADAISNIDEEGMPHRDKNGMLKKSEVVAKTEKSRDNRSESPTSDKQQIRESRQYSTGKQKQYQRDTIDSGRQRSSNISYHERSSRYYKHKEAEEPREHKYRSQNSHRKEDPHGSNLHKRSREESNDYRSQREHQQKKAKQ